MRRFAFFVVAAVLVGAIAFALIHRGASETQAKAPPPAVPVLAAKAQAQDVPIILRGLGIVTALNTVAIKSRVEGAITAVNFTEGQYVKKGDLLIQLDPRPFQAALDQAKANLQRDQAVLANAKTDLTRYSDLLKRNFAPEQQVATQQTTVSQNQASIESDQAAVEAAQLNVDYAALRSPIDGVTGLRLVDIGNLIQANGAQTLVTITQIEPITVIFTLPEADIDSVRQAMAQSQLTVQAYAANDQRKIADGTLMLIDNTVDQTTGTVKLKAQFPNTDRALWPGQFVNAHLVLETVKNGVTIPSSAVQTGPNGSFTYVIDDKAQVSMRSIKVRQTEKSTALIASGLAAGDQVVTAGQFRLQPGSKVEVTDQLADADQKLSDAPAGTDAPE